MSPTMSGAPMRDDDEDGQDDHASFLFANPARKPRRREFYMPYGQLVVQKNITTSVCCANVLVESTAMDNKMSLRPRRKLLQL